MDTFNYPDAFSRNIGVVSTPEHERLRNCTVAIAGMGGVGGDYLISLVRAGIGGFHLAEFDEFEVFKLLNGGAAARSPGPVWVEPESWDDIILCDHNPGVST